MLEGEEFRCALCRGRGRLPWAKAQCPACGGRGLIRITPPAITCAYCKGRGEVPIRCGIGCIVCGGKGVVSVRQPVEMCPECRGTGAARSSGLPCLACRGKGVVALRKHEEATAEATGDDLGWVVIRARRPIAAEARAGNGRPAGCEIRSDGEPILISFIPPDSQADRATGTSNVSRSQRRETRTGSAGLVSGLVRRLMASERARILGRKGDPGRYALEKRSQRWRESRKPFK